MPVTDLGTRGFGRAADGHRYDPNQPRVPAGDQSHRGGRWTRASDGATDDATRANAGTFVGAARAPAAASPKGVEVTLPNGWRVVDPYEPTAFLRSPVADLSPVAAAGRETGEAYRRLASLTVPEPVDSATFYLGSRFLLHVGTGGAFDYQRSGNQILGLLGIVPFVHLREFRDVANFNVGLFCQQAGLTMRDTLTIAGSYASWFSINHAPTEPYGLDPRTRDMIASGFTIGESGVYGKPAQP